MVSSLKIRSLSRMCHNTNSQLLLSCKSVSRSETLEAI